MRGASRNARPKIGDRIRLLEPILDAYPPPGIPAGAEGIVHWLPPEKQRFQQIDVRWDSGRRLLVLPSVDKFEIVGRP